MGPFQRRPVLRTRYGVARSRARGGSYIRVPLAGPPCPALLGVPGSPNLRRSRRRALGDTMAFSDAVEAWRDDVAAQAGDLPVDFLLAWIQKESGGNPCDFTSLQEVGISQLEPPDNLATAGTSMSLLHPSPPCTAGVRTIAYRSSLTDDQAREQVRAMIQYVNAMRARAHALLDAAGYSWSESSSSFWSVVKMMHVAPAVVSGMLQQGITGSGGSPPASWDDLVPLVSGIPTSWLQNATDVGAAGEGGGSLLAGVSLATAAVIGLGLWYVLRKRR